jgi:hypothetical protein
VRPAPPRPIAAAVLAALLCVPTGLVFGAGAAPCARSAVDCDSEANGGEDLGASVGDPDGGDRSGLREFGFRVGYGYSTREDVQVIPFYAHAGWLFPDVIDAPLARWSIDFEYYLEGWIGGVTGPQDAIEVGINPIGLKIAYDAGQAVVPYFSGGLGVLYTGLQGIKLGGPFEFNETAGVGVEIFLERGLALTVGYRYRHVSNADIEKDNRGLDTQFGTIGLSWYPSR